MYFETPPQKESVFWYVFIPWTGEPKEKHFNFQYAKKEAIRIAKKTGKETFLLQGLKSYKTNEIIETNFVFEPNK